MADIVITHHAKMRYADRIEPTRNDDDHIAAWLWECLKQDRITPYYRNEQDVYLIDEDVVVVAEFSELEGEYDIAGNPLHKMIVVTFWGECQRPLSFVT